MADRLVHFADRRDAGRRPAEAPAAPLDIHPFEEPGALERVAAPAAEWFGRYSARS